MGEVSVTPRFLLSELATYFCVDPAAEGVGVADGALGVVGPIFFSALWGALAGLGDFALAAFGLGVIPLAARAGLRVFWVAAGAFAVEGVPPVVGGSAARTTSTLKSTALSARAPMKCFIQITSSLRRSLRSFREDLGSETTRERELRFKTAD